MESRGARRLAEPRPDPHPQGIASRDLYAASRDLYAASAGLSKLRVNERTTEGEREQQEDAVR